MHDAVIQMVCHLVIIALKCLISYFIVQSYMATTIVGINN